MIALWSFTPARICAKSWPSAFLICARPAKYPRVSSEDQDTPPDIGSSKHSCVLETQGAHALGMRPGRRPARAGDANAATADPIRSRKSPARRPRATIDIATAPTRCV